jgi:hypothetical protein
MSEQDGLLEVDETLPIDQLRTKANEEMLKETPARDDKGRFVAQPQADGDPGEPSEFVATREIDLGDGSGVQVFEGKGETEKDALADLNDKLFEAQTNATKKIRQQEAELKEFRARTAEAPKAVDLTDDEEYILSQEIVGKKPSKALDKWFRDRTGMSIEELQAVKQRLDSERDATVRNQAIATFVATHPDFDDRTEIEGKPNRNGELMKMKLADLGLPMTSENLHRAYLDLKKSGLLVLKGEEAHADPTPTPAATERIAQPRAEATETRTRRSSGISTHGRPAAQPKTDFSEDELRAMPLEKLREISNKQLAG